MVDALGMQMFLKCLELEIKNMTSYTQLGLFELGIFAEKSTQLGLFKLGTFTEIRILHLSILKTRSIP